MRRSRRVVVTLMLVAALLGSVAATAGAQQSGRATYTGEIDGAKYRVEMPEHWNGTLVLFSHGYVPPEFAGFPSFLAVRQETEQEMLDRGYAVAGSEFQGRVGWPLKEALHDQIALLDWFEAKLGRPRHTFATGFSMGAGIAVKLAELYPRRFDGVLVTSAVLDEQAQMNRALDITFVVRTLLAEDQQVELVKAKDPDRTVTVLSDAVTDALATPQGRARLALAGAIGNIATWDNAHKPEPTELAERIRQQATWTLMAFIATGPGPKGRLDLERRAGGNPVYNVGVDYARLLQRSSQRDTVASAYRAAPGSDLDADLAALAAAPRIAPDPKATAYLYRYGVPQVSTPSPVLTLHSIGDGGAPVDTERWYTDRARAFGHAERVRSLYVNRGDHGAVSTAEEIVALQVLSQRVRTGTWPDLNPAKLNTAVAAFPDEQQKVLDIITFTDKIMPPAFVGYTPPRLLRPSF